MAQTGFYVAVAAIPASVFIYSVSRASKDGEPTTIEKWLNKAMDLSKEWERRNHNTTALIEQAAKDKHLFYNVERNRHIELSYPEYVLLRFGTIQKPGEPWGLGLLREGIFGCRIVWVGHTKPSFCLTRTPCCVRPIGSAPPTGYLASFLAWAWHVQVVIPVAPRKCI